MTPLALTGTGTPMWVRPALSYCWQIWKSSAPKPGGGVDAAGAGVQGDVLAVEDDALPVERGVLGAHQLERAALEGGQHGAGGVVDARGLAHALGQILGQHVHIAARHLEEHVVELRVEADGVVAGDRPGGGGPDHEVGAGQVGILAQPCPCRQPRELDEDGGAGVVGVLNLGLGQGGLVRGHQYTGFMPL